MRYYRVMTKQRDEDVLETVRTSKRAALQDVSLLHDICGKRAWIQEIDDEGR